MAESRVRQLAKAIQTAATQLRPIALQDTSLIDAHNSLCKVLDALNQKLARESEGMLPPIWKVIPKKVSK